MHTRMGHRACMAWCTAEYEKYGKMPKAVDRGHVLGWSRQVGLIIVAHSWRAKVDQAHVHADWWGGRNAQAHAH